VKKQLSVSMKEEREEEPAMQSEMCREIWRRKRQTSVRKKKMKRKKRNDL
jgi:hypothetical protein